MGDCITTYTGKHFDPTHPDEELICIEDIAHALSLLCRGNGHVRTFFSVGQHCILCAKEAEARGYSGRLYWRPFFTMPANVICPMFQDHLRKVFLSIGNRRKLF